MVVNFGISALTGTVPAHCFSNAEIGKKVESWLFHFSRKNLEKTLRIFANSGIGQRYSVLHLDELFTKRSLTEVNRTYQEQIIQLGIQAATKTLEKSGHSPDSIDMLITTSCTGFMLPSVDTYIINALNLRNDIKRLPVTELGCVAGVSALIYAHDYLQSHPDAKVMVICAELPSNTIQLDSDTWDNIVATALFGDGAAGYILEAADSGLLIRDTGMDHLRGTTDVLGYCLTNTGLVMNLDKKLPALIKDNFETSANKLLRRNSIDLHSLDVFLTHPGGVKILSYLDAVLAAYGKDVGISRSILESFGNMSSATVGFVLQKYLVRKPPENESVLLTGFGPGVSIHHVLFEHVVGNDTPPTT